MYKNPEGANPKIIRPIRDDEQEKRDWEVLVNGKLVPDVSEVTLSNKKIGLSVHYGWRKEGHDGVLSRNSNGGGVMVVPWIYIFGEIYIGMVRQYRPTINPDGHVWNVPGGGTDPGESPIETACRELGEETGFWVSKDRVKPLPGRPINPFASQVDTSRSRDGVCFFSVKIFPRELEGAEFEKRDMITAGAPMYQFKNSVVSPIEKSDERITGCYFMPWRKAMRIEENITRGAIATLISTLNILVLDATV